MTLRKHISLLLCLFSCIALYAGHMDCKEVFSMLDLNRPGLEKVKSCCEKKQWTKASEALLDYYRTRQGVYIPGQDSKTASDKDVVWADDALKHTFHVLEDPVWNYGKDINWEYWPVKDIEMRVQLHRQSWWTSLGKVFHTTKDEKYAREYVYEFRDWVRKNPYKPFGIDQRGTISSGSIDVDSPNECFAWRPLEVGIRLLRWCQQFSLLMDADSFTPEFLLEFLKSYHQNADVLMGNFSPAGNHLIHQSQGILRAGICFPEFKDAGAWLKAGVDNLNREISRQSFPDGCHFELDPGYHIGFIESYDSAIQVAFKNGKSDLFPPDCLERLVGMTAYYMDNCYPDMSHACFSDARRGDDEVSCELLRNVGAYCNSPEARQLLWLATDGKEGSAPAYKSAGHPASGFYTFRDGWYDGRVVMPVKATERGMWHAQPDFGTFELMAFGKILMPDAGAYTYSGDEEIERQRAYFKATARHNALTLDDRNYDDPKPELIEWRPYGKVQMLCVQHEAYKGLTRRRSTAFVEEKFFVIVDEVCGPATGRLTLRNGLGRGSANAKSRGDFVYRDVEVGMRLLVSGPAGHSVSMEKDWCSEKMHEKFERPVIRLDVARTSDSGVQRFVTVICPFSGEAVPDVTLQGTVVNHRTLSLGVRVDGRDYTIGFPTLIETNHK